MVRVSPVLGFPPEVKRGITSNVDRLWEEMQELQSRQSSRDIGMSFHQSEDGRDRARDVVGGDEWMR